MADVRALLRQQRTARRIEHPHAAYSEAGKLLCLVCHEHVKTETLWEPHIRGAAHRQRVEAQPTNASNANGELLRSANGTAGHKRKLNEDEEMTDDVVDEAVRKKRSKPDMTLAQQPSKEDTKSGNGAKPLTPPLTRRQSGTPTIGVEMQIPSRPATPVALRESASNQGSGSGASTATTPKNAPLGRSPLIPQEPGVAALPPRPSALTEQTQARTATAPVTAPVDDDVWAAFEADLVHGTAGTGTKRPSVAGFANDAVISAPAMTAAEAAAKSKEEEQAKRRALVDIQIEDEREDATRALETEFEVMEELEARARKLRERREALRIQRGESGSSGVAASASGAKAEKAVARGKENAVLEEDDDDDDDETEDDWVGFRFRA